MPGENYGLAYLDATGAAARQDIEQAKAPIELQHMKALTDLAQTQANGQKLAQEMQLAGLKALEGFQFDPKDPGKSLAEMAGRVAGTQPVLAEKLASTAQTAIWRSAQAANYESLAQQRALDLGVKKVNAMSTSYGGLKSDSKESMDSADALFRLQAAELQMSPEETEQAIETIHNAIKTAGPQAIEQIRLKGMTQAQAGQEKLRQQMLEEKQRQDDATNHFKSVNAGLAAERVEQGRQRLIADGKVDGATGSAIVQPVKGVAKPRIDMVSQRKTAAAIVAGDPVLATGDGASKLKWTGQILQAAVEKVDASAAAHQRNPNIPIKGMEEALAEAKSDLLPKLKQEKSAMDRLTGGEGKAVEKTNITQEDYAKLKKGDKFWFNGKEHTKE